MNHEQTARELFLKGYNCAQSVLLAFSDLTGLDDKTALRLSSSFGGGVGRLREICGAVSGMCMVIGLLYGYDGESEAADKAAHYERVQSLANAFRAEEGSYICRELLGLLEAEKSAAPAARTKEYYETRPCVRLVGLAARLTEDYIAKHPVR